MTVNAQKLEVMGNSKVKKDVLVKDAKGEEIRKVNKFKYLDLTLANSNGCEMEIDDRVQAGW